MQECGCTSMVMDIVVCQLIQCQSCNPWLDDFCYFSKQVRKNLCRFPHLLNLFCCLIYYFGHLDGRYYNLDSRLTITLNTRFSSASFDTTGFHQPVVMTHQEMTFDLLQSV